MKFAFTAIVLGLAVAAGYIDSNSRAAPVEQMPQAQTTADSDRLVVHEWGTFTSFSGSNGAPANFQPDNSALPEFVYHHKGDPNMKSIYLGRLGTISMETPVMYFYADHPLRADVRVGFPKGWITEWYPRAIGAPDDPTGRIRPGKPTFDEGETIHWDVKVAPGESLPAGVGSIVDGLPVGAWTAEFTNGVTEKCEFRKDGGVTVVEPRRSSKAKVEAKDGALVIAFEDDRVERWTAGADHFRVEHWAASRQFPAGMPVAGAARANPYFHARETDSAVLETLPAGRNVQREKFLFYRGVGAFPPPVTVRAEGGGKVRVRNASAGRSTGLVLVVVRSGRIGFLSIGELAAGAETVASLPPEASTSSTEVGSEVQKALVAAGLYEREAKAMVKTWDQSWFHEEGTRLLYFVPRARTDELLPLAVSPRPTELVRVMVGRHDFLTPEQEAAVDLQLKRLQSGQTDKAAVDAEIARLGRFSPQARMMAEARLR